MEKSKSILFKSKGDIAGKIIAGKYRYLKVLGTGGMGDVHLVSDIETGQKLAMKCCREEVYATRFEREVLSWMKVGKHPNVVAAIYFDLVDRVPTFMMEYVEGGSLKEVISESSKSKKDIPLEFVLDYAIQICRGMAHLHNHGVIHRDLKPSNILIAREPDGPGQVKITDMGISKIKDVPETKRRDITPFKNFANGDITATGEMLGTPQYMSPQQIALSRNVGEETDIYAFGVILYEMLAQGKKPFDADNCQGWLYANAHAIPKHVKTQVSTRFSLFRRKSHTILYNLVMQCLSKKAEERPKNFEEIVEKLCNTYQQICGKTYSRDQSLQAVLSQEEINNQAISLLEMGPNYVEEGWKKLQELCSSRPDCTEAQLNRLLFELKNGQCSMASFWERGRKILAENSEDTPKIAAVLGGGAIEKGSYYQQTMRLLESVPNLDKHPALLRLHAKCLYLGGKYTEAQAIFENLCQQEHGQGEDFYHWAGAMLLQNLQKQETSLCLSKSQFSVELERTIKQQIWYILRQAEEKSGPTPMLDRAKDVSIGASVEMAPFWHEHAMLTGHQGEVNAIAVSADAHYALSGGADRTVRFWDLVEKKEMLNLSGHTDVVTSVTIALEGNYGVSGSLDGTVRTWDLQGKLLGTFQHRSPVTSIALNSNKNWAISASLDGTIRIWNMQLLWNSSFWNLLHKKCLYCFVTHHGGITSVAIDLDGEYLLAGCMDGTVILWNFTDPQHPTHLKGHEGAITRVAFSADGKWAVSTSDAVRKNVFFWDLKKRDKLMAFSGNKQSIQSLAIASNAYWVLVSGNDGVLHVWDLKWQKRKVAVLESHTGKICDLAATLQGNLALSAGADGTIRLWQNSFIWPVIREQKYLKVIPK